MSFNILSKSLLCLMIFVSFFQECYSQEKNDNIYRKYIQIDSSNYKVSVLILYKDNTFINYGTFDDDYYNISNVWFASGKWSLKSSEISCQSISNNFSNIKLIEDIKNSYKYRFDYYLYDKKYKYIYENYSNYNFYLIKNKAIDFNKKIEYKMTESNNFLIFKNI